MYLFCPFHCCPSHPLLPITAHPLLRGPASCFGWKLLEGLPTRPQAPGRGKHGPPRELGARVSRTHLFCPFLLKSPLMVLFSKKVGLLQLIITLELACLKQEKQMLDFVEDQGRTVSRIQPAEESDAVRPQDGPGGSIVAPFLDPRASAPTLARLPEEGRGRSGRRPQEGPPPLTRLLCPPREENPQRIWPWPLSSSSPGPLAFPPGPRGCSSVGLGACVVLRRPLPQCSFCTSK